MGEVLSLGQVHRITKLWNRVLNSGLLTSILDSNSTTPFSFSHSFILSLSHFKAKGGRILTKLQSLLLPQYPTLSNYWFVVNHIHIELRVDSLYSNLHIDLALGL